MTQRFTAVLVALLVCVGVQVGSAPSASAYSSTQITSQYWWPHNGCSSPFGDHPSGVSFTYACNHHDGCYWGHWASKATCDWWFYNDMRQACAGGSWCNAWAVAYYAAVTKYGGPFYACRCDPNLPSWMHP